MPNRMDSKDKIDAIISSVVDKQFNGDEGLKKLLSATAMKESLYGTLSPDVMQIRGDGWSNELNRLDKTNQISEKFGSNFINSNTVPNDVAKAALRYQFGSPISTTGNSKSLNTMIGYRQLPTSDTSMENLYNLWKILYNRSGAGSDSRAEKSKRDFTQQWSNYKM